MKSIPVEIFIYIFRLLHQNDKLHCMLVCHEWESVIRSTLLFETLSISSKERLKRIVSNVQKEPFYGMQVKRLLIQVRPGRDFDLAILPRLFPNVHDFYINSSIILQPEDIDSWHSKLRHLFGCTRDSMRKVIGSQTWSNLATLELSTHGWHIDTKDFLNPLLNTPAVKSLKLHTTRFSMDDFEFIHNALPSLKSLSLTGTDYTSTGPPKGIVPASTVTSFSITDSYVRTLLPRKMLYRYILQKYPNLLELSMGIGAKDPGFVLRGPWEAPILTEEWDDLLMSLAPHLQKLHLQLRTPGEYSYVLDALDRSNCQLKSLVLDDDVDYEVINLLSESNQSRSLRSLTIKGTKFYIYDQFISMKMLTELHLHCTYDHDHCTVQSRNIERMCGGNIESLKITHLRLGCCPIGYNITTSVLQVKKLELIDVYLTPSFGTFIARAFQQLHTLKLRDCFKNLRRTLGGIEGDINIMIPFINLQYLEIIDTFDPGYYVLVITLCDNKKRMYTAKSGEIFFDAIEESFGVQDNSVFPPPLSIEYGTISVSPIVTIVCNSVENIFLGSV